MYNQTLNFILFRCLLWMTLLQRQKKATKMEKRGKRTEQFNKYHLLHQLLLCRNYSPFLSSKSWCYSGSGQLLTQPLPHLVERLMLKIYLIDRDEIFERYTRVYIYKAKWDQYIKRCQIANDTIIAGGGLAKDFNITSILVIYVLIRLIDCYQ